MRVPLVRMVVMCECGWVKWRECSIGKKEHEAEVLEKLIRHHFRDSHKGAEVPIKRITRLK